VSKIERASNDKSAIQRGHFQMIYLIELTRGK